MAKIRSSISKGKCSDVPEMNTVVKREGVMTSAERMIVGKPGREFWDDVKLM